MDGIRQRSPRAADGQPAEGGARFGQGAGKVVCETVEQCFRRVTGIPVALALFV